MNLVSVFCLNGNLNGLRMMHSLGADLRWGTAQESPLKICLRWHYAELVSYLLSLRLYSIEDLQGLKEFATNKTMKKLVLLHYPELVPKKPASTLRVNKPRRNNWLLGFLQSVDI